MAVKLCTVAVALAGILVAGAAAEAAPKKGGNCVTKYGRGWAFSEAGARFQAWEIIAQTTGNWPFKTDTFRNERYKCQPEGAQVRCDAKIDVCKS